MSIRDTQPVAREMMGRTDSALSTSAPAETTPVPSTMGRIGKGRWIEQWDPENVAFWHSRGRAIALRNLIFSIAAEHIGFSVWLLWSIVVVKLYGTYSPDGTLLHAGANGWALTPNQGLTLLAVASGVGAFLRIPYTFAVPIVGGRNWTVVSSLLLLIPTLALAWVLGHPETPFSTLMVVAATAGFGGGNFASSMANISFFYPEREKGWALGLNAAGGNIGVAVAQKLVPVAIGVGGWGLATAGLVYVPLAVASAVLAFLFMDNLREAKADPTPTLRALGHGHTWVMALLYVGTFGSFIGYSAAFPTLLTVTFGRADIALAWGFAGALLGSLSRPFGGRLADRFGGAIVTLSALLAMAGAGYAAVLSVQHRSLSAFFGSFVALFIFTGAGNGATYRMIPAIFGRLRERSEAPDATLDYKRRAAGAVGIISSIGAFGGFAIPFVYLWSRERFGGSIVPALEFYVAVFVALALVTWVFYLRRGAALRGV
jgi:NNP family nitrate/nitrite transporter-like MFS transporter